MSWRVKQKVLFSLNALHTRDIELLQNNVCERAIVHRLAIYLGHVFPSLHVDCEYNRNSDLGENVGKLLDIIDPHVQAQLGRIQDEEERRTISVYPDIIVHRRLSNLENELVVEVKKNNSTVDRALDYAKLRAFTENAGRNRYHFKLGVFILLQTGNGAPRQPSITWFRDGREYDGILGA